VLQELSALPLSREFEVFLPMSDELSARALKKRPDFSGALQ